MLEIHPADAVKTAEFVQAEGQPEGTAALRMTDGDREIGYVLYRMDRDTLYMTAARCEEPDLYEWLLRAAMNAGVNRNAITAVCEIRDWFSMVERFGFEKEGERYTVFIPDFFTRPCQGCRSSQ